jgi:hypothetical protein
VKVRILFIGDTARPEFHEACAALDEVACAARFRNVEAASAALANGEFAPHGIVLAQGFPGQYVPTAIEQLRAAAPLARLIVLLGSWCEGESRSGRPICGAVRVYWHEAAVRFRRELPSWFAADSAWSLPVTATDEERLLAAGGAPLPPAEGLVAIWTWRREMAELLADACRAAGYATAWLHPRVPGLVQGAAAAIFDGDSLDAATMDELAQFAARVSPAPVMVLLQAPRIQDARAARTLGAVVLAKPFRVDELLWALQSGTTSGRQSKQQSGNDLAQRRKRAKQYI